MKKISVVFLALFLSACAAPKVFTHNEKGPEEFNKDLYDCQVLAAQITADQGYGGNPLIIRDETTRCMIMKHGWKLQDQEQSKPNQ